MTDDEKLKAEIDLIVDAIAVTKKEIEHSRSAVTEREIKLQTYERILAKVKKLGGRT